MMNNLILIIFLVSIALFIISVLATRKTHVGSIVKTYFTVYLGGMRGEKRRVSVSSILSIGVLPYVIGITGTLLFRNMIIDADPGLLISFDGMMISILSVFFGFGVYMSKDKANKYTTSILFVSIFLLLADALILWSIAFFDKCSSFVVIPWCFYYGIKAKVLVLFFVSLHNIYYINVKNEKTNGD